MTGIKSKHIIALCISLAVYIACTRVAIRESDGYRIPPLKYIFPEVATQLLSFGDRYLAANINYARVVTLFNYSQSNVEPRSILLEQATALNPKHLDVIYQAAILPWEGEYDRGVTSLEMAKEARYWDWRPPLMLGITQLNFARDYSLAANQFSEAAARTDFPRKKKYLNLLAAQTHSRGDDVDASIAYIEQLVSAVKQDHLKSVLLDRAKRLYILKDLRVAANRYETRFNKKLDNLDQLLETGILKSMPEIIGVGYALDEDGRPDLYERLNASNKSQ